MWTETHWRNLANPSVPESLLVIPNDGNGFDLDSTGLYQQRPKWWGDVAGSMDPYKATGRFLTRMLTNVPSWADELPGGGYVEDESAVCQWVQQSQFDGKTINPKTGAPYPFAQNYRDESGSTDALAAHPAYFTEILGR